MASILATHIGCAGGMGKTCFTKKVLSSTTCGVIFYIPGECIENSSKEGQTCQKSIICRMATNRIHEHSGSIHRTCVHDSVNIIDLLHDLTDWQPKKL